MAATRSLYFRLLAITNELFIVAIHMKFPVEAHCKQTYKSCVNNAYTLTITNIAMLRHL